VPGGVVTTVVGADVWIAKSAFRVINPQIGATIGVAKQALRYGFVLVDARNVSFCCLSRHGQNCSRHHRENAEQGVAGLTGVACSIWETLSHTTGRLNRTERTMPLRAAYQFLSEGTALPHFI